MDDEEGFRDLMVLEFGLRGYETITAANGEQGVVRVKGQEFDVVVSDVTMPRMGGCEALATIKELQPKVEVIMVTGHATLDTAIDSMKKGAYDYITKPFQIEDLARLVERALEKKRLHEQVNELQVISQLKSAFLANMSHELRTPMNAILGYTSLILDKAYGDVPEKQEKALKRIEINAKNLLEVINNILDLSKLSAGKMPVYMESCNLSSLVAEVIGTVEALAQTKHLNLITESDVGADVLIHTDKTKLKQILINLLGNAIKFTETGEVALKVEKSPEKEAVLIRVRDTGIGISQENLPILFEEFKQVDSSSTRERGGTGLGLSITKKLIALLGGSIHVESASGVGSVFTIELPLRKQAASLPMDPSQSSSDSQAGPDNVLLAIDDDPEVLALLKDSLEGTGFSFVGAQSGEEGLELARKLTPSVITLDIMMPRQDGWAVLQIFKNDPKLCSIPVIVLSILENKALGYSLGISDYIVKPFDRRVLLEKLRHVQAAASDRKKILVIAADLDTPRLIKKAIQNEGYEMEIAVSGRGILEKIESDPPDVLFVDLVLPEVSGFEILAAIDKNPDLKNIRVIVMTAKNLTPREMEFLQKRVEMVVQKETKDFTKTMATLKQKLSVIQNGIETEQRRAA